MTPIVRCTSTSDEKNQDVASVLIGPTRSLCYIFILETHLFYAGGW